MYELVCECVTVEVRAREKSSLSLASFASSPSSPSTSTRISAYDCVTEHRG